MSAVLPKKKERRWIRQVFFCVCCVLINLAFAVIPRELHLPLYLDTIGTILASVMGGSVPGIIVGYLTNIINGFADVDYIYYAVINVLIAVFTSFFERKGWFRKITKTALAVMILSLTVGTLGSVLTWLLYGFEFGDGTAAPLAKALYNTGLFSQRAAQLAADIAADLVDKTLSVVIVLLAVRLMPRQFVKSFHFRPWKQNPLHGEERRRDQKSNTRGMSLRGKIMIMVSVAMLLIAIVSTSVSFIMFRNAMIDAQINMAHGVANVVADAMDPDMVEQYLTLGEDAPGYAETEKKMIAVRESSEDISYVYVYQIREDGCHVVFDPDTGETKGDDPGSVRAFDPSFLPLIPDMLAGKSIAPIISNDTFGWLLTIYRPVFDAAGKCVCYAGVDISMVQVRLVEYRFLAKAVSLFMGFFITVLGIGIWLAEYNIVLPINSMARVTGGFAYDSETQREESVEKIQSLGIRTGDEIENLYGAITKMSGDTVHYIADVQQKSQTISRMQDRLIAVLADMVESRDQYTGNHIWNTAAYVRIILEELRRENLFTDVLTDEYISDVLHSAPLHDVGKIHVSDTLLNKPGKLTEEEFSKMKEHTLAGREIISQATSVAADSTYLKEAQNLATYHHERWDGSGYPFGLKGEDIPLSARIMAVADVFDALVSKRSYKDGFPVDKALRIIREGSGTHFDPRIVEAFMKVEQEARSIAEKSQQTEQNKVISDLL